MSKLDNPVVLFAAAVGTAYAPAIIPMDDTVAEYVMSSAEAQTFGGGSFGVQDCSLSTSSNCGTITPPVSVDPNCPTLSACNPVDPPVVTPPPQPPVVNPPVVTYENNPVNNNNSEANANAEANAQADANAQANATGGNATANGGQGGTGGSANNNFSYRESRVANTAIATVGAGFCAGGAIGVQTFWAGASASRGVRMTCVDAVNSSNEVVTAIANGDACERAIAMTSNERMANSLHQNYEGGVGKYIADRCTTTTVTFNDVVTEAPATYSAPYEPAEVVVRDVPLRASPRVID